MIYITKENQSLIDICMTVYGTLDKLSTLLKDNNLKIDSVIANNTEIIYYNSKTYSPMITAIETDASAFAPGTVLSISIPNIINTTEWIDTVITATMTPIGSGIVFQWQYKLPSTSTWIDCDTSLFPGTLDPSLESYFDGYNTNELTIVNCWNGFDGYRFRLKAGPGIISSYIYSNECTVYVTEHHQITKNWHDIIVPLGETFTTNELNSLDRLGNDLDGVPNGSYATVNIMSKFKAIWPMMGHTANKNKPDILNGPLTAYNMTYSGSVTHLPAGIKFEPTGDGQADTHFIPSGILSDTSFHFSVYSKENISNLSKPYLGGIVSDDSGSVYGNTFIYKEGAGFVKYSVNDAAPITSTVTSTKRLNVVQRKSSLGVGNTSLYQDGTIYNNDTGASIWLQPVTNSFIFGKYGPSGLSNYTASFGTVGDLLLPAELQAFKNAVDNFQTTMGRYPA